MPKGAIYVKPNGSERHRCTVERTMANALVVRRTQLTRSRSSVSAAQYVRMSTDKQRYSIQNQAAVIAAYAHMHGLQIVETYRDEGESGLRIKNRAGLRQLIA